MPIEDESARVTSPRFREPGPSREDELERFARAFKTETQMHRDIAALLRKMGREEVRITHGPQERGKDVVFYGPAGLNERSLYACVVKRDRIVGDLSSNTSAKTVLMQAEEAFDEPYTNPDTGQQEQVKGVYIISPYECTTSAIEAIRSRLKNAGKAEFCCGVRLMELFATYWQSYFVTESNVLVSYLSALRAGLQRDTALLDLILQRNILADAPCEFKDLYVQQSFSQELRYATVCRSFREAIEVPTRQVRQSDIRALEQRLGVLLQVAQYLRDCNGTSLTGGPIEPPDVIVRNLAKAVEDAWAEAYRTHVAEVQRQYEALIRENSGRDRSSDRHNYRRAALGAPRPASPRSAVLTLKRSPDTALWCERVETLRQTVVRALGEDCATVKCAESVRRRSRGDWLRSRELVSYGRLADLEENVPGTIKFEDSCTVQSLRFESDFLDDAPALMLIAGPAGSGKTSFCKWQSLTCADSMLSGKADVLPVFIPLHRFAYRVPNSPEEAFFDSQELRELLAKPGRDTRIRMFLDGLDEVPDQIRQRQVVKLARQAAQKVPDLQIVITARDYVVGPWLDGASRLRVDGLGEAQQRELAKKWLESDEAVATFFGQLSLCEPLQHPMRTPLLATLILAVYKKQQYLPGNRTALYALFVELMCGGWDSAKRVYRASKFGIHDKKTVLQKLAGMNHLARTKDGDMAGFRAAVEASLPGFSEHADDLLSELYQDGLIVSTGAGLRFSHLSFQEYLAAESLADPEAERPKFALKQFYSGDDWWKEVLIFYITRSANPGEMEDWIVKRARQFARTAKASAVLKGELEERLGVLRRALVETFPAYRSKYSPKGLILDLRQRKSGDDAFVFRSHD